MGSLRRSTNQRLAASIGLSVDRQTRPRQPRELSGSRTYFLLSTFYFLLNCEDPNGSALRHLRILTQTGRFRRACIARESIPNPDWTATYCLPSTRNDTGTPMIPELVGCSHKTFPFFASKARNMRSLVPPANTSPPPVVRIGPQFADFANVCVHTRLPLSTLHACTSPMCFAPGYGRAWSSHPCSCGQLSTRPLAR